MVVILYCPVYLYKYINGFVEYLEEQYNRAKQYGGLSFGYKALVFKISEILSIKNIIMENYSKIVCLAHKCSKIYFMIIKHKIIFFLYKKQELTKLKINYKKIEIYT
jgi:hypothetical protein